MSEQKAARRFVIRGRVQGVGYRAFAIRCAKEIGVAGWVKNLADGSVEAKAVGSIEQLDDFEGRLRQGPTWSDVRAVDVTEIGPFKASGFRLR